MPIERLSMRHIREVLTWEGSCQGMRFICASEILLWLFRYPRSEPDCTTWVVSSPDQPHIRSSHEATAPKSCLRQRGSRGRDHSETRLFRPCLPAVRPPGSARTDHVLEDFSSLSVYHPAVFITAPSMTTPAVTYFHSATSSLRASATMVFFL